MALTRDYKETLVARIKRDRKFARALYAEAVSSLVEGETGEGLSMLRDLVHAQITFKELARQTGLGEKTLHRMLNRNGNPIDARKPLQTQANPRNRIGRSRASNPKARIRRAKAHYWAGISPLSAAIIRGSARVFSTKRLRRRGSAGHAESTMAPAATRSATTS
jgi:DNA-binding phage protein